MRRTRVKICGLTRDHDIAAAVELGVDALGLVFYAPSPRAVSIEQAASLVRTIPAFVTVVGLFVDAEPTLVRQVLDQVPLGALQFHGREPADYCAQFKRPWIKSIAVQPHTDFAALGEHYQGASALLLDTFDAKLAGGTGQRFDWTLIPATWRERIILAGGLNPANVAAAIAQVRPFAVDVSGGVEQAKGIKDRAQLAAFMQEVYDADQ